MGFFSRHDTSTVSFCFSIMFLSFSLFHLEEYRIRLNNQPVSGLVCLDILRVNSVLFSEGLKLFSLISRRMLHNLI